MTGMSVSSCLRVLVALGSLCTLAWDNTARAACEEALVKAAYQESSAVHTDYRLATLVTQSMWDQASHDAGASADLFGIPVGANYQDYSQAAQKKASSLNESYSHDQLLSIAWSGLDASAENVYRACLENTLMQANGLQAAVVAADQSHITIRVHWFVPRQLHAVHVSWSPKKIEGQEVLAWISPGYTSIVVPRPRRSSQTLVANYLGWNTDPITLYPYIPPPPAVPTPPAPPPHPAGWYGFSNSPNIDREGELRAKCASGGSFTRAPAAGDFNALCQSVELNCKFVCDWQGNSKPCGQNPQDGSRLAMCK